MKQVTFEKHILKGEMRPGVNWRREIYIPELIKAVGFDPATELGIGLLEHEWTHAGKSHPYNAIVIAPDINLLDGDEFFVSNESWEEVRDW